MSYLVDTNVLSELRRRAPHAGVVDWFAQRPATTLYLSVLTLGEIRKIDDPLPDNERKLKLLDWLGWICPPFFVTDSAGECHCGRPLGTADCTDGTPLSGHR